MTEVLWSTCSLALTAQMQLLTPSTQLSRKAIPRAFRPTGTPASLGSPNRIGYDMKLSDFTPEYQGLILENLDHYEDTLNLSRKTVLEALLRGEGIIGYAGTILEFVAAIEEAAAE